MRGRRAWSLDLAVAGVCLVLAASQIHVISSTWRDIRLTLGSAPAEATLTGRHTSQYLSLRGQVFGTSDYVDYEFVVEGRQFEGSEIVDGYTYAHAEAGDSHSVVYVPADPTVNGAVPSGFVLAVEGLQVVVIAALVWTTSARLRGWWRGPSR